MMNPFSRLIPCSYKIATRNWAQRISISCPRINTQQSLSTSSSSSSSENSDQLDETSKYIDDRLNSVFNIILADIYSWQEFNKKLNKPNAVIYEDVYNSKDQILQDLFARSKNLIDRNYNIHELIEDEFQLEISDYEFESFKSLKDIQKYVKKRWEIRKQLTNAHSPDFGLSSY